MDKNIQKTFSVNEHGSVGVFSALSVASIQILSVFLAHVVQARPATRSCWYCRLGEVALTVSDMSMQKRPIIGIGFATQKSLCCLAAL